MSNENDGGWGSFDWVSGGDSGSGGLSGADWGGFSWSDPGWSGLDTDFFDFAGGVGRDQPNDRGDVIKLESLLGNTGHYDVSRTDGPTGWWGTPLENGLKSYQKDKGLAVDGFVLPKGETLGSLKDDLLDTFKGFRAPTYHEVDRHHTNNRLGEGGLLVDRPPPVTFHPNPDLPKLETDAFQANRRSAGNLAQIGDPGDFPNLAKLAVGDYGDQAIVELRDLVGKIGEINPTIADLYGRVIKNALEPEDRVKFLGGADRPDPPLGVLKSQAEDRFGPFPSPDEARQALADDIAKWGEDADQNATVTEDNGVVTATSLDGTHIAIRDTKTDAGDGPQPGDETGDGTVAEQDTAESESLDEDETDRASREEENGEDQASGEGGMLHPTKAEGETEASKKSDKASEPKFVKGHVAKNLDQFEKDAKAKGHVGESDQCVALVKAAVPGIGPSSLWKEGDKITGFGKPPLERGTAIATFENGKYMNRPTGNHAAIFLEYGTKDGKQGMWVLDQSAQYNAGRRFISFNSPDRSPSMRGERYSVIRSEK